LQKFPRTPSKLSDRKITCDSDFMRGKLIPVGGVEDAAPYRS